MRGLSILKNIILGLGLYFMDFSTDIIFSIDMFNNAGRNFTNEQKNCTEDLYSLLNKTTIICQEVWIEDNGAEDCNNFMRQAEKQRHTCFETGARFDDPYEWKLAGAWSMIHCFTPIIFALIVFICSEVSTNSKKPINRFRIPIPFLTKWSRMYKEWKLYLTYTDEDAREREKIKRSLKDQEDIVILSMAIESASEACFQFFFQTTYLLPSIILAFMDIDGANEITNLVNYRILSILLSFATFAWASFTIR